MSFARRFGLQYLIPAKKYLKVLKKSDLPVFASI